MQKSRSLKICGLLHPFVLVLMLVTCILVLINFQIIIDLVIGSTSNGISVSRTRTTEELDVMWSNCHSCIEADIGKKNDKIPETLSSEVIICKDDEVLAN